MDQIQQRDVPLHGHCINLIVTQHPALRDLLIERGLACDDVPCQAHVDAADVVGLNVLGNLPLHLAACAASVTVLPLAVTPEDRKLKEIPIQRLRKIAGEPRTFIVQETGDRTMNETRDQPKAARISLRLPKSMVAKIDDRAAEFHAERSDQMRSDLQAYHGLLFEYGPALRARRDRDEEPEWGQLREILARYFRLLDRGRRLARATLTPEEQALIADISNRTLWESWSIPLLYASVEESAPDGVGEKWAVDLPGLAARLRRMADQNPAALWAIVDAAERFWHRVGRGEEPDPCRILDDGERAEPNWALREEGKDDD